MKRILLIAAGCALLAACGTDRPAPGAAPGWDTPTPPRGSMDIPVPMRDQYLPPTSHKIQQLDPVPDGHNVPYAVRGAGAPSAGAVPGGAAPQPACHKVPTVTVDGKPSSTVCPQADGSWAFVPD